MKPPLWDPPLTEGERRRMDAYHESTRCPECGRYGRRHFPRCSQAGKEANDLWKRRVELRALRTMPRIGSPAEGPADKAGVSTDGAGPSPDPLGSRSAPAGELEAHLDQEHDADEGRPWI